MKKTIVTLSTLASVAAIYVVSTYQPNSSKCLNTKGITPTPERTFLEPVRSVLPIPQPYEGGTIKFSVGYTRTIVGIINTIHKGLEDTIAIGGNIKGGWFAVIIDKDNNTEAFVMIEDIQVAYVLDSTPLNGTVSFKKKSWNEVM